jgi:hypothetical protein
MQTFRPRITLDGETPSPMNHLQCRPWNQANRAGADENPKADAVFALSAAIGPDKPTPFATACRTISVFSIGRGNSLIKLTAQPLSSTLCRPKTSGSAHLRKLERQLEPKPEENEGHFSRAQQQRKRFSGQNRVLLGLVAAYVAPPLANRRAAAFVAANAQQLLHIV